MVLSLDRRVLRLDRRLVRHRFDVLHRRGVGQGARDVTQRPIGPGVGHEVEPAGYVRRGARHGGGGGERAEIGVKIRRVFVERVLHGVQDPAVLLTVEGLGGEADVEEIGDHVGVFLVDRVEFLHVRHQHKAKVRETSSLVLVVGGTGDEVFLDTPRGPERGLRVYHLQLRDDVRSLRRVRAGAARATGFERF